MDQLPGSPTCSNLPRRLDAIDIADTRLSPSPQAFVKRETDSTIPSSHGAEEMLARRRCPVGRANDRHGHLSDDGGIQVADRLV